MYFNHKRWCENKSGVRWRDKEGKVPFLSKKECISTIKDEKVEIKRHVAQRMT